MGRYVVPKKPPPIGQDEFLGAGPAESTLGYRHSGSLRTGSNFTKFRKGFLKPFL